MLDREVKSTLFLLSTDEEPPNLQCPEDISENTDEDQAYATVSYEPVVLSDNDGNEPTLTASPMGDQFQIGETEVTLTAQDEAGNMNSCTFNIIVTGKLVFNSREWDKIQECLNQSIESI